MPRNALSKRQRKAQRKTAPKAARQAKPWVVALQDRAAPAAPRGQALVEANRDDVALRERQRISAAVLVGDMDDAEAQGAEVAVHRGDDLAMVTHDRRDIVRGQSAIRVVNRDGLAALHRCGVLTDAQVKAGFAYRLAYEGTLGLGSALGNAGEGRVTRDWSELKVATDDDGQLVLACSAMDLHRSYVMARLNQLEREVGLAMNDGRELVALRGVAGEGRTLREVAAGGGRAAVACRDALIRALDVVARVLRITER